MPTHRIRVNRRKKTPARAFFHASQNYLADIKATVVSSMRFEKPHSLSYHDDTFTRRPDTLVRVESKFDEAGLWLKSIDTSGSVWYVRMPSRAPSEADFIRALTSSTVVSRLAMKDRSTSDTLMVGTRIAKPSSLPFSSGSTRPTAAAAPVLVGIMLMVAERARRKSSCITSDNTWSLV